MPYAIRNRRTKKFVTGTDFRYNPPRQITSKDCAYIYDDEDYAIHGKNFRRCGKDYEIVPVRIEVVEISHGKCNQCRHYEGVRGVNGHAPCSFWGIGGVLSSDYCSRFEKEGEQE